MWLLVLIWQVSGAERVCCRLVIECLKSFSVNKCGRFLVRSKRRDADLVLSDEFWCYPVSVSCCQFSN